MHLSFKLFYEITIVINQSECNVDNSSLLSFMLKCVTILWYWKCKKWRFFYETCNFLRMWNILDHIELPDLYIPCNTDRLEQV